jgi:hypothetical protein
MSNGRDKIVVSFDKKRKQRKEKTKKKMKKRTIKMNISSIPVAVRHYINRFVESMHANIVSSWKICFLKYFNWKMYSLSYILEK